MLDDSDKAVAQAFRHRVTALVPVLDLIVFGSRARGDAMPDSDLDIFLLVIEQTTPELRRRISELAWEVGFEHDRVITTVVATTAQLGGVFGAGPLWRNICREGVRP